MRPRAHPRRQRLGQQMSTEHFSVTLTSDPKSPKVGETKFSVEVLHHGAPAEDAKVRLSLSMPTMDMGGPEVELKHTSGRSAFEEAREARHGRRLARSEVGSEPRAARGPPSTTSK